MRVKSRAAKLSIHALAIIAAVAFVADSAFANNQSPIASGKCPAFFSWLFGSLPSKADYVWPNGELSDAQWRELVRFSRRVKKMPGRGASIEIRPRDFFQDGDLISSPIGVQTVRMNGAYENLLLDKSGINSKPREVLNFRLHLSNGKILETPIFVEGNARAVNFEEGAYHLFNFLRGRVTGIEAVEVVHTHPSMEVRVIDGTVQRVRSNELSAGDLQTAKAFASRFPAGMRVILRAVTPNGYGYEMRLPTGR